MTLRNAFGDIALDATSQDILAALLSGSQRDLARTAVFGDQYVIGRDAVVSIRFDTDVPANLAVTSGTVTQSGAKVTVGPSGTLYSRDNVTYDPGFDIWMSGTAAFTGTGDSEWGLFTDDLASGLFIGLQAGTPVVCRRVDGVDQDTVVRSSWDDPLDGTGASGLDLDLTKAHVFRIRTGLHGNGPIIYEVIGTRGWVTLHVLAGDEIDDAALPEFDLRPYLNADANSTVVSSSVAAGRAEPQPRANVSAANSTTTPLAGDASFVGEWVPTLSYSQINVTLETDQPSAASGMKFEFSDDGVTAFTDAIPSFNHAGTGTRRFQLPISGKFFRVNYTNGATPQTDFRVQTLLLPRAGLTSIVRVGDELSDDRSATVVKALIAAQQPDGGYVNSPAGGLDGGNSTQDNLDPAETFVGEYQDARGYSSMLVFALSDQPLDATIQWSPDGSTPRSGLIGTSDLDEEFLPDALGPGADLYVYLDVVTTMIDNYYRLELENTGASATTLIESDVWLYTGPFPGSYGALDDDLSNLSTGLLTRSVIMGQQPDGEYVNTPASGSAYDRDGVQVLTEAALGAAGVYESGWVDTDGWSEVELVVATDQVSGTGGIEIEHADDLDDTTPTVRTVETFTFTAGDVINGSITLRLAPIGDGVRFRYTNGGTPQGSFYLEATLRVAPTSLPRAPLASALDDTSQAVTVRGPVSAKNDAGDWGTIAQSDNGGLRTSVVEHEAKTPLASSDSFEPTFGSVGTTPAQIATPALANRTSILIINNDGQRDLRVANTSSGANASSYLVLAPSAGVSLPLTENATVYVRSGSANCDYSYAEFAEISDA